MIPYLACILLICIGIYAVGTKRNLIKIVIGFTLIEYGVNLFFVMVGYKKGALAPIIQPGKAAHYVDPIPQALILTAIVIGLGVTALMVALCIRLYAKYGTFDIREIRKLRG